MDIKNFQEFSETKSGDLYDYGCVMVYCKVPGWGSIIGNIAEEDLYQPDDDPTYGRETSPHCTILYGLHSNVQDRDVIMAFEGVGKKDIRISVDGIGCFENPDYDVVKMNVVSPKLSDLNSKLSELPHTTDFPDYKPHITIAYVKPGLGRKYVDPDYKISFDKVDTIVYTKTDGKEIRIPLI